MASTLPPVKGSAFSFALSLVSQADTDTFQDNPTLAAGDVKVVKDGVLDGNIDNLPTAVTSLTRVLNVTLSADEMTADRIDVLFHDAAGSEWQDALVTIYTAAQTLDTTDGVVDGVASSLAAGVPLADDAITSAKFDETTAFPLKAADSGVTYIMRTGADGDTAETLSDQVDALNDLDSAAVQAAAAAALTAYDPPTDAEMDAGFAALNDLDSTAVQAAAAAALTAYDPPTDAEMDAALLALQGADGDTLESLSDQLDGVEPADVWSYATRTLTSTAASTAATTDSTLNIVARATYQATISGMTISASWSKIWLTIKSDVSDADASSVVQIVESSPGAVTDGLLYLNGAAATAAQGSLTVDQSAGTIDIVIADEATDDLTPAEGLVYDIKQLVSGVTTVLAEGIANVTYTATAAIA